MVGGYFGVPNGQAINAVGAQTTKSNGAIGGIQAGFNWQAGRFLAGVEVDFNYFGLRGSNTANGLYPTFRTRRFHDRLLGQHKLAGDVPWPCGTGLGELVVLRDRWIGARHPEGRLHI